jgi:rare lipoprotein A
MRALATMVMPLMLVASAAAQDSDAAAIPAVAASAVPIADMETEIDGGMASYYGNELAGNRTANGERFDPGQLTAAHRTLPFGSKVRVTNMSNGDSVIVRINDRGPFSHGRVIDVSHAAAREIGMHRSGTARVKLVLLNDD